MYRRKLQDGPVWVRRLNAKTTQVSASLYAKNYNTAPDGVSKHSNSLIILRNSDFHIFVHLHRFCC